jgi:esterase/lipase superfamily enzyme
MISRTAERLLELLELAEHLQPALDEEWPSVRDRLLTLAGRLELEGDSSALGRDVDAFVEHLVDLNVPTVTRMLRPVIDGSPVMGAEAHEVLSTPAPGITTRSIWGQKPRAARVVVLPVFYGTNRMPVVGRPAENPYGGSRGETEYGVAEVSIPVEHTLGELETPRWWRFERQPDPAKHVVLRGVNPMQRGDFVTHVRASLADAEENAALLFLHGYNVSFVDAARRAAQVAFDLKFGGRTLLFSWASVGDATKYTVDEATIEWSRPHIDDFFRLSACDIGATSIHVIAHSMGSRALAYVLDRVGHAAFPAGAATLQNVIFAAPDVDADTFRQLAGSFRSRGGRFTLYASSRDVAIRASRLVHRYPRAGEAGDNLVVMDGVDTVDASAADTSLIGVRHSYFADKRSILSDICNAVVHGQPPNRRFDIQPAALGNHWVYRT